MRLTRPVLVAAATFAASPALAASAGVQIDGVKDDDLRKAIVEALPKAPNPPETLFDARRRGESAAKAAMNVLYAQGYYGASIKQTATETPKPHAVLEVDTGPLFLFKPSQVEIQPDVLDQQTRTRILRRTRVRDHGPATGAAVIDAETRGLDALRRAGYAEAQILEREAIADHADNSLAVKFRYRPGPKIVLGDLRVDGNRTTDPDYLQSLRSWKPGDVYKPATLDALTDRIASTDVYDSGAARIEAKPAGAPIVDGAEERRDVVLNLAERKKRTITLGGSYSTSEGLGVEGSHVWRNLRHQADSTTLTARVAELESVLTGEIAYPHWRKHDRTLKLATGFTDSETDAFNQKKISFDAGVETDRKLEFGFGYGVSLDAEEVRDATGKEQLIVAGVFGNARLDRTNDFLDPRRGYRAELRIEPAVVAGDDRVGFTKTTLTASAYKPLGDRRARTVAAARFKIGSIVGAPLTGVPADYRFYAGGGGSVRGYDHQALSPSSQSVGRGTLNSDAFEAFGGRSLIEGSVELRYRLNPTWGVVGFVDAGSAGANIWPDMGLVRTGAGLGVRYYTGFGPLRFDIAMPLDRQQGESKYQIYVSIGQSF